MVLSFLYNELANHGDLFNGHGHRWTPGVFFEDGAFSVLFLMHLPSDNYIWFIWCSKHVSFSPKKCKNLCLPLIFPVLVDRRKPSSPWSKNKVSLAWNRPAENVRCKSRHHVVAPTIFHNILERMMTTHGLLVRFSNQEIVFWTI